MKKFFLQIICYYWKTTSTTMTIQYKSMKDAKEWKELFLKMIAKEYDTNGTKRKILVIKEDYAKM